MSHHQGLQNVIEDQLSLAAIHFLRTHYQEAIDIYKKILLDNRYNYAVMQYSGHFRSILCNFPCFRVG